MIEYHSICRSRLAHRSNRILVQETSEQHTVAARERPKSANTHSWRVILEKYHVELSICVMVFCVVGAKVRKVDTNTSFSLEWRCVGAKRLCREESARDSEKQKALMPEITWKATSGGDGATSSRICFNSLFAPHPEKDLTTRPCRRSCTLGTPQSMRS